mmetsp:Transcript_25776/g.39974  ORF Transcript_25776/g.39974 Transcript_25776/m.39974 type:complete len:1061 (+) Transcript_25776:49-3231(+)
MTTSDDTSKDPSLPDLLASLALGAKSVNSLPLTSKKRAQKKLNSMQKHSSADKDNKFDDEEDANIYSGEEDDDELAYYSAFPEFSSLMSQTKVELTGLMTEVLSAIDASSQDDEAGDVKSFGKFSNPLQNVKNDTHIDFDDPLLWEACADACDALLERVDAYLAGSNMEKSANKSALASTSKALRQTADSKLQVMISGLANMEKPQVIYNFAGDLDNSRTTPYMPRVASSLGKPSDTLVPIPGHGLPGNEYLPEDVVAPDTHYDNPLRKEIEGFEYQPSQLQVPSMETMGEHGLGNTLFSDEFSEFIDKRTSKLGMKGCGWIDSERDLITLVQRLSQDDVKEIAVDLEAHSWRSFSGFTCLMQISVRPNTIDFDDPDENKFSKVCDFIVDTLSLRKHVGPLLAPIFANPLVVKVMHGADSDIPWLQRDFGIYVVNLFDTGRAARALSLQSFGLAHLLHVYAGVSADKRHQLSDWRKRPLPEDMLAYARSDTHYLLDIYDRLRHHLEEARKNGDGSVSIKYVLDESRTVCLRRFTKEPFKPSGWKNLNRRSHRSTPSQLACLRRLWDWRDATARELDESNGYVCPNSALARIATVLPSSTAALQRLINPLPLPVLHSSQEILDIITASLEEGRFERIASIQQNIPKTPVRAHESDTDMVSSNETNPSKVLSPVLGTEALYKQAGWTTPIVGAHAAFVEDSEDDSNASDGDDDPLRPRSDKGKPNSLLLLNVANKEYNTDKYMAHSLELDSISRADGRSRTVDGLGAARAVLDLASDPKRSIEDEVAAAERAASSVMANMEKTDSILNISQNINVAAFDPLADLIDVETKVRNSDKKEDPNEILEELGMPKSMREMYHDHMNSSKKRKQKKDEKESFADEMDVDTLEGAEDQLRKKGYYDKGGIFYERENTSGSGGGQEANLKLVQEVNWISSDEAAKKLIEPKIQDKTPPISKSGKKKESKDNSVCNSKTKPKTSDKMRPFDYSNSHSVGLVSGSGSLPSDNPFFSGAARNLESVTTKTRTPDKKKNKQSNMARNNKRNKGKHRVEERPQGGGNRTHVYRN